MIPRIAVAALVLLLLACTGSSETQESMPIIRLHQGQYLLEERILEAKIIARVRLRSHEVVGAQFPGSSKYRPAIKFTFDALEYLKGTGGGELVAYAYGDHYYFTMERDTAKEAVDLWSSWISGYRDGRWDDRQAIIFLRQPVEDGSYVIGFLGEYEDSFSHRRFVNRVTIADDENRAWLPAAASASAQGSDGNAQEQHFLLEDPDTATTTSVSGAVGSASAASTISKASLKSRIAAVEAELAANNTDAYRNCLIAKYEAIRTIRYYKSQGIPATNNYELDSGLPADTRVGSNRFADDAATREWYEGRDKDLFTPRKGVMYTNRPLPAGEYRFYYNDIEPGQDCGYSEEQRTELLEIVTVTAPAGTLAESFFDPYASSTAVVGTTTVGTISWQSPSAGSGQAGKVTADLTRSVTGHALDFIDLTGATTLSLSVADAATTAAGALTWAVSEQPWKVGDKLMLRIRVGESGRPVAAGPEPDAAFGPIDQQEPESRTVITGATLWIPRLQFAPVLEEMIVKSKVIARVRLSSIEVDGVRKLYDDYGDSPYNGALKFTLDVLECIKGSCGSQLTAYAYGVEDWGGMYENDFVADTADEAKAMAPRLLVNRDARWDNRDALVMLRYNERDDRYYLGMVSADGYVQFTVAGPLWRAWLPDSASPPASSTTPVAGGAASSGSTQHFLLEDPDKIGASASQPPTGAHAMSAATSTISLDDFKAKVSGLDREYNGGDGSVEWKECIIAKYEWESQSLRETEKNGGRPIRGVYKYKSPSGLPAKTLVRALPSAEKHRERYGDTPPPTYGNYWTEGRDKELLVGDWPGEIRTSRPLIAGEYRVFELWRSARRHKCDAYPERERERFEHVVTVTAPAGTLAESFFDPYASSTAIIGTTTMGTIGWQSGEVTADLTRSVTGHVLNFIDLKGTTTLSLLASNATTTAAGALAWAVNEQPWKAGDKLMLRIRK